MYQDRFVLTPTNPNARCTPLTVAAHTMYEKTRPDRLPGPGGVLYLDRATYLQEPDGRSVVVQGAEFRPTRQQYEVKLEGARKVGFRSIFIGAIRDPILIDCIHDFLVSVRKTVKEAMADLDEVGGPQLFFHLYGKNAVMGPLETSTQTPHEIGVLGEAVAQTPEAASALAEYSRTLVLHGAYKGQLATAGNLASPLTPLESDIGPVFEFSLYHLMEVDDPKALFPIHVFSVGTMTMTTTGERPTRPLWLSRSKPVPESVLPKKNSPAQANGTSAISLTSTVESGPRAIRDLASVVRSKNSRPFEVTLDILFANNSDFERAQKSNVLTAETVRKLYRLKPADDIITLMFFEPALGWKCTFKRPWPQGSIGERDTFGTQLHAPLLSIVIP
ncbi:caib baif family enzyme [Fonsecaea pedrosoi]|nr:caib baif family enzyme [Fonsecaea pedrosoi]